MKYLLLLSSLLLTGVCQANNTFKSITEDNQGDQADEGSLGLVPELTLDDNTLKPRAVFTSRKPFYKDKLALVFDLSINSGLNAGNFDNPTESTKEIISEYVADGGNVELDLGVSGMVDDFYIALGGYYSLVTTDAISTKQDTSEVVNVDAEVYGMKGMLLYKFSQVRMYATYTTYNTTDDGQNADFTSILDDGHATTFGLEVPLSFESAKVSDFVFRLERTKHSEIDKAIFRISVAIPIDLG